MKDVILQSAVRGAQRLADADPALYALLGMEHERQLHTLSMVAASSVADPSVLFCEGASVGNTTGEGYPGARYHAGCGVADEIERLAIQRAKAAFGAEYANVQPHSGTSANQIVMFALLEHGDTVLGLDLDAGGHLSHGATPSVSSRYWNAVRYGLNADGWIDYDRAAELAREHRPRLIVCGASAYPRRIDFARFRAIADEVGAYLLADISHIAGLVAAGEHPSPIQHAHFTTTSTYKQLFGPRGGLILMGPDHAAPAPRGTGTLADMVQRAVFPFFQGTPSFASIAAKARALAMVGEPRFRALARTIADDARALASILGGIGYQVVSGGTDNHIVLLDLGATGISGQVAESALESCGIIVNKNRVPGDRRPARVTSGIRLGTNSLALRGMGPRDMGACAALFDVCLRSITPLGDREYSLDPLVRERISAEVRRLCARFPLPHYADYEPVRERRADRLPEVVAMP